MTSEHETGDPTTRALEQAILKAHADLDLKSLVSLYCQAAADLNSRNDADREAFLLTYAWIFALELGDARVPEIRNRLLALGRLDEDLDG